MAEQAYAYVTLIPVAKGFQQAVAKEMRGVNNVGAKAGQDAGKGFSGGFGGALKALGGVVATGLAAAGIGNFVKESISAASDLEESLNAVSVAYGDASANVVALGEDAAARLGVTQADFNASAVRFSAFAERVVGEGGNVAGFVDDITTRAADFASVFNIDVSEALQVFQSGLSGEAEPLKRFGINLLDSEVQAYALRSGLIGVGEQMTEDIKTQARYGLLMESTAKTQGDFANTSDGLANSQRILKAQFEDIQAEVGGPLLGAFAKLTQGLIPVVQELAPVLVDVMGELAPTIENVAGQIPGLLEGLFPLIPVIGTIAEVFFELVNMLLPIFTDLLSLIMPIIEAIIPIFMAMLEQAMVPLSEILYTLVEILAPFIEALLPIFVELFEALLPIIVELLFAFLPLVEQILPLLLGLIEFLVPILTAVAEIIGEVLVFAIGLLIGAIEWVTETIGVFATFFEDTWGGIKSFFTDIINGMIAGFEGFVNGAIKGVNRVIDAINSLSFTVPDWVPEIGGASFGFNLPRLSEISLPRVALAEGGLVTRPTNALIGEAGPEVVIPLDRFERMLGDNVEGRTVNYYAAPNKSFDAEQELRLAMTRARVLA